MAAFKQNFEQGGQVHTVRHALAALYVSLMEPGNIDEFQSTFVDLSGGYQVVKGSGGRVNMKPSEQYNAKAMSKLNLALFYNSSGEDKTRVQGKNVQMASSNQMLQSISTNLPFRVFTGLPSTWKPLTTVESLVEKMELYLWEEDTLMQKRVFRNHMEVAAPGNASEARQINWGSKARFIEELLANSKEKLMAKLDGRNVISQGLYKTVDCRISAMQWTPSTGVVGDAVECYFVLQPCLLQTAAIWNDRSILLPFATSMVATQSNIPLHPPPHQLMGSTAWPKFCNPLFCTILVKSHSFHLILPSVSPCCWPGAPQ